MLLEVKVAEMSRQLIRELGVESNVISRDGNISIGALSGGSRIKAAEPFQLDRDLSGIVGEGRRIPGGSTEIYPTLSEVGNFALFASFLDGNNLINLTLDAAREDGLARILAEPTLTTLTGEEARFLAGGEFPVPVARHDSEVTVMFKEFGIGLTFLPLVLDSGTIHLQVDINVSELSHDNSLQIPIFGSESFFIPSLTKRSVSTTVELGSGETIGIAGLINETLRERINRLPGLGDVPTFDAAAGGD